MLSDRHHTLLRREEGNNEVSRLSADKMESMRKEIFQSACNMYHHVIQCYARAFVSPARLAFLDGEQRKILLIKKYCNLITSVSLLI